MYHSTSPDDSTALGRRQFLRLGLASGAALLASRFTFAAAGSAPGDDARLVFIILRGALDGLAAVPPYGDPQYAALRAQIALAAPGSAGGALALDNVFGLNPGLSFLHEAYGQREALVFHAVATPYRERSHFDGQDVLETGLPQPHASASGWLNRALLGLPVANIRGPERAVALGPEVPLLLRGPAPIASWAPSRLPAVDDDTLQRIADRYASDPLLAQRLAAALATDAIAAQSASATPGPDMSASMGPGRRDAQPISAPANAAASARAAAGRYLETVRTAAQFIARADGPRIAVFDTIGWDTHFNEGGANGQLTVRLRALDAALATLKQSLGPVWARTAVLMATEFGRTVATNGTAGTDHGTGAAAFLLGGAVNGGRVVADWPGLSAGALYQGRDLRPTLDLRSVLKSVLHDHLHISIRALDSAVFPHSHAPYLPDLLRA
ncbi:MAG: DUF1501 domain-containing protein [Steroidobacteraceae bacterium]